MQHLRIITATVIFFGSTLLAASIPFRQSHVLARESPSSTIHLEARAPYLFESCMGQRCLDHDSDSELFPDTFDDIEVEQPIEVKHKSALENNNISGHCKVAV